MCKHVDPSVSDLIISAIAKHIGVDTVRPEQTIVEAGGDSLDTLEIPWELENLFGLDRDSIEVTEDTTIADIIATVAPRAEVA